MWKYFPGQLAWKDWDCARHRGLTQHHRTTCQRVWVLDQAGLFSWRNLRLQQCQGELLPHSLGVHHHSVHILDSWRKWCPPLVTCSSPGRRESCQVGMTCCRGRREWVVFGLVVLSRLSEALLTRHYQMSWFQVTQECTFLCRWTNIASEDSYLLPSQFCYLLLYRSFCTRSFSCMHRPSRPKWWDIRQL